MGNHAKRVRTARTLKEQGLGKLYRTGNKRRGWRELPAWILDCTFRCLSFKPGMLAHDCDGFNHRIVKWMIYRDKHGTIGQVDQFVREDGWFSCGCSPPDVPHSREAIEQWMLDYYRDPNMKGWLTERDVPRHAALERGEHICDEDGLLLPIYRNPFI